MFINATNMGTMVTRKLRELLEDNNHHDISTIANTYHSYQNDEKYEDKLGFCKKATLEEIKNKKYSLNPGAYVGTNNSQEEDIPFDEKMEAITRELKNQFEESHVLEERIRKNLGSIGYEI